jgi:putative inorganic carbon (hco3(-)) transporter
VLNLAVLAGPWPRLGVVAVAALAAAAMLSRSDRQRALAMLGALVLAPALLLDDVWHSSQLGFVHRHPLEVAIGAVVVLVVLAGAAVVMHRHPWLVAPMTALTVPFRVPIAAGGASTNYLLVPLYFVVAASALGWLVPALWASRADAPRRDPDTVARPPRITLLFEQLLGAYLVLYALQALYTHGSGSFPKALQNEAFFYVPFAILLARLRDIEWDRTLLLRSLKTTVVLAVVFSLIGFEEEATKKLLISSKLVTSNQLHQYFTVNSVFFDPNIFGRYIALVMILLTAVLLYDRRMRLQLSSIAILAVLWGCLVFTLSRSSFVSLALGLAVLAALRWRTRPVLYLGAVVVVVGAIVLAIGPSTFGLKENLNTASDGRVNLITGGKDLFVDRPILGWGSGSFSGEYTRHFRNAGVSDSHNIAVTIGAEQGVIGELLYIALVVAALGLLFRGARGDPFRVGIAAAFLALVVHTMFYADFLEDPVTWTLLAVGGALVASQRASEERSRREERSRALV